MQLSRILHSDDYKLFTEHLAVDQVMKMLPDYRFEHEHRRWEYGLAMRSVLDTGSKTVLDVGGAGSVLSPLLAYYNCDVTQLDPEAGEENVRSQNKTLGTNIKFISGDFSTVEVPTFDAVVSVSTIEHVEDDITFFKELLKHANKSVFLTMDFFPTRETFSKHHIRTYNRESIHNFCEIAKEMGFSFSLTDYVYEKPFVYEYTFASLFLVRNS